MHRKNDGKDEDKWRKGVMVDQIWPAIVEQTSTSTTLKTKELDQVFEAVVSHRVRFGGLIKTNKKIQWLKAVVLYRQPLLFTTYFWIEHEWDYPGNEQSKMYWHWTLKKFQEIPHQEDGRRETPCPRPTCWCIETNCPAVSRKINTKQLWICFNWTWSFLIIRSWNKCLHSL